jgi:hypothetical protein
LKQSQGLLVLIGLGEQGFNPVHVFGPVIKHKDKFRNTPQPQPQTKFMPKISGGGPKPFECTLLRFLFAGHRNPDVREPQIRPQVNLSDGSKADPGILQLQLDHLGHFCPDLVLQSRLASSRDGHGKPLQSLLYLQSQLKKFNVVAGNILSQDSFGFPEDIPKNRIQKRLAVGNGNNPERCDLPDITVVQFRHSNIEPGPEAVPDLAQNRALLLE